MAPSLRFRAIDHSDGALQPWASKYRGCRIWMTEPQPELRNIRGMKELFVAASKAGADALALSWITPIRRCRHRSAVGAKSNEKCIAAIVLPHELPHIKLTAAPHFRRPGVPQVRVMSPEDHPRVTTVEMRH